jgi:hypothetical protein
MKSLNTFADCQVVRDDDDLVAAPRDDESRHVGVYELRTRSQTSSVSSIDVFFMHIAEYLIHLHEQCLQQQLSCFCAGESPNTS